MRSCWERTSCTANDELRDEMKWKDKLPVAAVWGRSSGTGRRCRNDSVDVLECSPPHVWCCVSTLWRGCVPSWKPAQPRLHETLQSINQSISQTVLESLLLYKPETPRLSHMLTELLTSCTSIMHHTASGGSWRRQPRSRKTTRHSVRTAVEPPVQTDPWWSQTLGGGFSFTSGCCFHLTTPPHKKITW